MVMPRTPSQRGWLTPGQSRVMLRLQRQALERALDRGEVIPKDPRSIKATPPRAIGRRGPVAEPIRLALIRQRAEALRGG